MKIILAADLKDGMVVHGRSGNRSEYAPLTWGLAPSAEPLSYIAYLKPKYLYIADLNRIAMDGDHTETVLKLASMVTTLYADRGTSIPEEYLPAPIMTIVGTETMDAPAYEFDGGILSIDVKDGAVIPTGEDPVAYLAQVAADSRFDGYLILNISSVGTGAGLDAALLARLRAATDKPLYYGGGVASLDDLKLLEDTGFAGAIVSTAVHTGNIPLDLIRSGESC